MIFLGKDNFTVLHVGGVGTLWATTSDLVFVTKCLRVLQFCKELTLCCKSVAERVAPRIAGKDSTRINSEVRRRLYEEFRSTRFQ